MPQPSDMIRLDDRALIRAEGLDAADFLQNIMSNDIEQAQPIVYSCLLSPQGQFLHDFFVIREEDNKFLIDIDAARADDLVRRLSIFKLRAKVTLTPVMDIFVYAGSDGFQDPRLPELGRRLYSAENIPARPRHEYDDLCISLGVPPMGAIRPEKDVLADINLDLLNAVGWDKGCFIGQEVTARMKYRGLAKKRLLIIVGSTLPEGMGEVRMVNSTGEKALALVKLGTLSSADNTKVAIFPAYVK